MAQPEEIRDEANPRYHTASIKSMLQNVKDHAREDIAKIEDPQAKALFEVTAEVLQGLITAYDHYEGKTEKAWR